MLLSSISSILVIAIDNKEITDLINDGEVKGWMM